MPSPLLTPSFGDDAGFRDIGVRLKDLDRQVRELRAGVGSFGAVYNSSGVRITDGGSLTIDGGGTITGITGGKTFFEFNSATGTLQGTYLKIVDTDFPGTYLDVVRDVENMGIRITGWPTGAQLQFWPTATFLTGAYNGAGGFINFMALYTDGGSAINAKNFYIATPEELRFDVGDATILADSLLLSGGGGTTFLQSDGAVTVQSVADDVKINSLTGRTDIFGSGDQVSLWGPGNTNVYLDGTSLGSPTVYNHTTTASANLVIDGTVHFARTTSASRYKLDQQPLDVDPARVLAMEPRTWIDKAQHDADPDGKHRRYPGFVAEEVTEALASDVVTTYNSDGAVDGLMYDRIPALHQIVLRDLDRRLTLIETALEAT